ncbi:MAG: iron ABC transporter permease [Verrucomicrobiae bacterium]|nr:iron ABC transporter permease [Verrucomicrobiae bacterium]
MQQNTQSLRLDLPATVLTAGVVAFFGIFLVYPVAFMLRHGFGSSERLTFDHFIFAFANPLILESITNSLAIALMATFFTTVVAVPLAYLLTHYAFPGRTLLNTLLLAPMILPPFVGAVALRQLLARFGSVNLILMELGLIGPDKPIDWLGTGGYWGIVTLQVIALYPIMLLNIMAAMSAIDPSLTEAAQNLGAGKLRVFMTITLPLIVPGWFAGATVVFIWAFTDLGTPLVFGYSRVVAVQIFDSISQLNTNPSGYALVVVVLLLTMALFVASKRLVRRYMVHATARVSADTAAVKATITQTCFIWLGAGAVLAIALLPHLSVIVQSFSDRWFMTILPSEWTLDGYREIFGRGLAGLSVRNSLTFAGLSAAVDVIIGMSIAWLLTRRRVAFAGVLDALAMLPLGLPGLILAFGYVAAFDVEIEWLNPRHNPAVLLVISYSVRRLPYIVRSLVAGFQQSDVVLEEASANMGASPWRTLVRITVPLVRSYLVAGATLVFAFAVLEVSDSLILAMREQYYPITKMIYQLLGRIEPTAPTVACALGVIGVTVLGASLALASRIMGKRLGAVFRI